jgi:asparagine synthase (glutamine-hydrolysing)
MCAICGIIDFDGAAIDPGALRRLRDEMVNRGPEHGGEHFEAGVALGHRRLRIIDLSPAGSQPMTNEDGTVWVTFNGEIYNFQQLRAELERRGHKFASHSDTEVIVHGWEEWGEGVIARLDGMFAIGIWDRAKRTLLLARDRFGKKPLYVVRGRRVVFASELKAIATLPELRLTVDPGAIDCYLHHLGTTQARSIYREVGKIEPGYYELFSTSGHRRVRYWKPEYGDKIVADEGELVDRIDAQLREAVKKRLVADVPLGAFLSGGVDSSLVVAMTAQLSDRTVKTFTIGFEEQEFSEIEYARQVAKRYGTDHEEISLRPDVLAILPQLVWEYGEPFADSSCVPTYYVSLGARRFVTVALTGDGGDELFGGYDSARAAYWAQQYERFVPGIVRGPVEDVLQRIADPERPSLRRKLRVIAANASADPAVRWGASLAFSPVQRQRLYTDAFRNEVGGDQAMEAITRFEADLHGLSAIDRSLLLTLHTRLANDYLVKVDVASMKVALELRSPFLDTDLSALSGRIDPMQKVSRGRQKYLLKKVAERYLPHDVIYRPKRGFSLPLRDWLRKDLGPTLQLLPTGRCVENGWFRRGYVEQLMREHASSEVDHTHRLWSLLWLELWHRMFIDKTLSPTDTLH